MRLDSKEFPTDCWRYEYRDGGGPWFRPDGAARDPNNVPPAEEGDDVMYGCDTLEHLKEYMAKRDIDTSEMYLVHYFDIEATQYNPETGHVTFLRKGFE
jgi:hypothetical protein